MLGMTGLAARTAWRASERARKRRQAEQDKAKAEGRESEVIGLGGMGRQAYVALGGMIVSIHGMWGFALGTAQLPEPIAVGFIAMFDAMELVLFSQLYQRANPRAGWTTQLRLIHNTAWALVAVSATANFIHAPNPVAAPFMAAMPIGAAWVIELEFRARMRGTEQQDDTSKAGPVRLLVLLWTKGWAAAFSGLGLDPNSTSGQVARATLAKKAARKLFRLRTLLASHAKLITDPGAKRRQLTAAVKELEQARKRATNAMDRADFATDSGQALAVLRGLGGWTEVDSVATVDFKQPRKVTELMERVAIMPAAKAIEAGERAAELEEKAERAEAAEKEAVDARQRAEEEMRAAVEAKKTADAARQKAQEALAEAKEETERAKAEAERAEDARQRADTARQRAVDQMSDESKTVEELQKRADEEQQRLDNAVQKLGEVRRMITDAESAKTSTTGEVDALKDELQRLVTAQREAENARRTASDAARQAANDLDGLRAELGETQRVVKDARQAADQAVDLRRKAEGQQRLAAEAAARRQAEAAEAQALLDSLRPQLADRLGGQAEAAALATAPAFRSEAKQAGWEEYIGAVHDGRELPTAQELAVAYNVSEGNARNWLADFKERRAAMIANGGARQTEGETERSESSRALPSGARQEPSGYRADGHERAEDAAQTRPINGQRQPV
ncbi:large adhesin (plasmid) [Streptomyces malaysiensis subsp. malaysiensis]|nr:large adhesin [Streptomyces malaysiensis]